MTQISSARRDIHARMVTVALATIALVGSFLVAGEAVATTECGADSNPIVCENSKRGTDPEVWDIAGAGDPSIQGFSTDISVNVGARIDFKIDTDAPEYTIDIYRTGWYQGLGARWIDSVTPLAQPPGGQPQCVNDRETALYDCGTWNVSASWNVPTTAVSGVYVALLTRTYDDDDPRSGDPGTSHITFVVRDQSSRSEVVFQTSDPTWQAYNTYGGSDFYQGAINSRAFKVSYNRPMATRGAFDGRDFYFSSEYAMVRFLEKNGYDVSYISGVDTDRFGSLLLNHEVFLSVGHDEYWSAGQRANVEAARDAGVNLQFLSGNEAYWRTRYEPSADLNRTPYRTLVSYKETWNSQKLDDSTPQWTGTWRDPRFASPSNGGGMPENALTGTGFMANHDDLAVTVTRQQGKLRLWRNTELTTMTEPSRELAPHTIGYESNEDLDNGFRPSGLVHLSTTVGPTAELLQDYGKLVLPGTTTHHLTLYRASSGALVFSAGSVQWAWGLDQKHDGRGAPADLRMQQAQVNLLADMGAQPRTLAPQLVPATASTDTTAPVVQVTAPAAGSSVPDGASVVLTGTATDAGVVAGVNVSTDGGVTWHPASGTTSWQYTYVQHGRGPTPVLVRAVDDSGNYSATPKTVTYDVAGPFSVFGQETPPIVDAGETLPLELGLKFTPTVDGYISGVRFYKSAANTGTHTGSLWNADGLRLATVTFRDETASGWQTATFTSAVEVTAGTPYVVSYFAPKGRYSASRYHWISRPHTAGPLAVAGGYAAEPAGRYGHGNTFPMQEHARANYYVDAIFDTVDSTTLTAYNQWPLADSTSVRSTTSISAVMSKPIKPASAAVSVTAPGGTPVTGTTSYDATTKTITFQPTHPLEPATTYTVTVSAAPVSGTGGVTAGDTWSFTTAVAPPSEGVCPCSVYSDSSTPGVVRVGDTNAVTLGMRFTPTSTGVITAMRFYKNAANTGPHVATLWRPDGSVLATASFVNESAAGWQTAQLATPAPLTAGATYTVSYRATVGNYSATIGAFSSGVTRGPLSVPAAGAVYTYDGTYPTTPSSTSYLVDVVFERAPDPMTVESTTPGHGATRVDRSSTIVAELSADVAPGYSVTAESGGVPIAGTAVTAADGSTIVFTPAGDLPAGALVTVTLTGAVSTQGIALPPHTWSFTTIDESTTITRSTLFGDETPAVPAIGGESAPVELGVVFTPSTAGSVTAIRFFKGAGNTGTHVGHLWSPSHQLLASATFIDETATGWQTARLSKAVPLVAGQTYTVSYFSPHGHYGYTPGYFSSAKSSGPLTAPATVNGRYVYTPIGARPTETYNGTNYFVDVVFEVTSPGG
jgi:hypothetical protein